MRTSFRSTAAVKLRDRDAIITSMGIIFRVYGYLHPPEGYVCDVEYAPSNIFQSAIPKAFRRGVSDKTYYKFFEDEGLRFIRQKYPQYQVFHEPLQKKIVGVKKNQIKETRKPERKLQKLVKQTPADELHEALLDVLKLVTSATGLKTENFGVFGSLLHGFYHPRFSDLDFVVYGKPQLKKLREYLSEAYESANSPLKNEFEKPNVLEGKKWRFHNYSPQEFLWHQRRKLIYGVYHDAKSSRVIKVEFEPVKEWNEIRDEYSTLRKITRLGWAKALVRVTDDAEAAFMPAVYTVETLKLSTSNNVRVKNVQRVVSYVEEFRLQAFQDETVYVEGNLEKVETDNDVFHQITLTRCPNYYEQTMKLARF